MPSLEVAILPALTDNYIYVIYNRISGWTAAVDPSEASPVLNHVARFGGSLHQILCTHHHWDHVGGNVELKAATGCSVMGSRIDEKRIPGLDVGVEGGDSVTLGGEKVQILPIPGHTRGHIAYYFVESELLFCGDTVFSVGCGRIFEGTYSELWESLRRLSSLPPHTKIYCGHEYTLNNLNFALDIDPGNRALKKRHEEVVALTRQSLPTLPTTLHEELKLNPFLRAKDLDQFTSLRQRKDNWK